MIPRVSAGELALKASKDNTKYEAREVGHAITDDVYSQLLECIAIHNKIFDEDEYCIVLQYATDPLIKGLKRKKFYGWMYLPSPRPDQAVFLYNKRSDTITKRLWVLPNPILMAKLAETLVVPKEYETMQAWSIAFYKGTFWDFIRYQHNISMLSESEYLLHNREELIKAGCKIPNATYSEAFDFSKVSIKKIIDTQTAVVN